MLPPVNPPTLPGPAVLVCTQEFFCSPKFTCAIGEFMSENAEKLEFVPLDGEQHLQVSGRLRECVVLSGCHGSNGVAACGGGPTALRHSLRLSLNGDACPSLGPHAERILRAALLTAARTSTSSSSTRPWWSSNWRSSSRRRV